jgi:hypothetical protein
MFLNFGPLTCFLSQVAEICKTYVSMSVNCTYIICTIHQWSWFVPHIIQLRDTSKVTTTYMYGTQNYAIKVHTQGILLIWNSFFHYSHAKHSEEVASTSSLSPAHQCWIRGLRCWTSMLFYGAFYCDRPPSSHYNTYDVWRDNIIDTSLWCMIANQISTKWVVNDYMLRLPML